MCWLALLACNSAGPGEPACGPSSAVVARVIDGDTVELDTGNIIRYLSIDTPEIGREGGTDDCFGAEARMFNSDLVLYREISLLYDVECNDRFERTLAYVSVGTTEINALLVERGYACELYIPPNGADRHDELASLEAQAKAAGRGMWGACEVITCE